MNRCGFLKAMNKTDPSKGQQRKSDFCSIVITHRDIALNKEVQEEIIETTVLQYITTAYCTIKCNSYKNIHILMI